MFSFKQWLPGMAQCHPSINVYLLTRCRDELARTGLTGHGNGGGFWSCVTKQQAGPHTWPD